MLSLLANTHDTDDGADYARPERKRSENARAHRIGIWVGPKTNGRSKNDEEQRTGAEDEKAYADSNKG